MFKKSEIKIYLKPKIFLIYFFYSLIFWSGVFTINSSLLIAFIALIFLLIFYKDYIFINSYFLFLIVILTLLITYISFEQKFFQINNIYKIITSYLILIIFFILASIKTSKLLFFLKGIYLLNFLYSGILALIILLFNKYFNRIYFNFSNANITSSQIAIGFISAIFIFSYCKNNYQKIIFFFLFVIIALSLIFLNSKGVLISLSILISYFLFKKFFSQKTYLFFFIILILLFLTMSYIKFKKSYEPYSFQRINIWLNCSKIISENYFLGVSNFQNQITKFPLKVFNGFFNYAKIPESPHNGYLYLIIYTGIIFSSIIFYLIFISFNLSFTYKKLIILKSIIIFILLHSIVEMNIFLINQTILILYFITLNKLFNTKNYYVSAIYLKLFAMILFIIFLYFKITDVIYIKAFKEEKKGNYLEALNLYELHRKINPIDAEQYQRIALLKQIYFFKKQTIEERKNLIRNLEISTELENDNYFYFFNLAVAIYRFNNPNDYKTIKYYLEKSLEKNPVYVSSLFFMALNEKNILYKEYLIKKLLKIEPFLPAPKLLLAQIIENQTKAKELQKRAEYEFELSKKIFEKNKNSFTYPLKYLNETIFLLNYELENIK
ncbi:MAG TPA: hypothetical protein PLD27_03995 [bacterium]|mgnify:CR=1 FL=1|nr:hypothetical protein [bacterium]HOL47791.1 hypothetical protein [bacterium]HPQ18626.1 hypothetical protein [bacterium]